MRVANTQVLNPKQPLETQVPVLQTQLDKMFQALQGRISFGTGDTGQRNGNIAGEWLQFTTAVANAEVTVAHGLGSIPLGRIVIWQDKAGSLYQGPSTGTAWTSTNVYFKCDVASVTFLVFLVKKGATS